MLEINPAKLVNTLQPKSYKVSVQPLFFLICLRNSKNACDFSDTVASPFLINPIEFVITLLLVTNLFPSYVIVKVKSLVKTGTLSFIGKQKFAYNDITYRFRKSKRFTYSRQ